MRAFTGPGAALVALLLTACGTEPEIRVGDELSARP